MSGARAIRPAGAGPALRAGAGAILLALAVATAAAAPAAGAPSGSGRAKRAYYTRRFDLGGLPEYTPGPPVTGTLRLWGLNYLKDGNLADYWEAGFRRYHPGVHFEYHLAAAFIAISGLVTGQADLGPCRRITFNEIEEFERMFHYPPAAVMFTSGSFDVPGWNNAFAIFVHRTNPLRSITVDQLDGIFGSRRDGGWSGTQWHPEWARGADQNLRTWGQLGLTGPWANRPIHVYGVNLRTHQSITISDWFLRGSDQWNENLRTYTSYTRPDGTSVNAAAALMEDLSRDPAGIAYGGIQNLKPATAVLAVAARGSHDYVPLTLETVRDRTYPLADADYFYFNRQPGTPLDPKVREFLLYVLSRQGQAELERDGKYLPLPAATVRAMRQQLE